MPEVIINGPEGRIEARYTPSKNLEAPIALILHPEPNQGGTMNNKVIFNLYKQFVKRNFSTLRFNFRGVGKSQGSYDDGEGELAKINLRKIGGENPLFFKLILRGVVVVWICVCGVL